MKQSITNIPRKAGFTLLEVLMATALFGLVMVGLTGALNMIVKSAIRSGEEVRMIRNLETLLTEASKAAQFEEGELYLGMTGDGDGIQVSYDRIIEELDELENMDGQILQGMWRIAIVASYEYNGEIVERVAETFRYEPLYQANR
ncbi:MAG: prepilin-type N-terminal cleavage/methylation domain-containing protein [Verrucomicrobiales bacterium]|jgi:prepilin-type N-terminal cleavage/methylation domain-containing protein